MKFLPLEKYTLVSPLKPEEIFRKLEAVVETSGGGALMSYARSNKPYKGKISGSSFEISRIIGYRNSFKPVIIGEISGYSGTDIKIYMRMHKAVIIFCCVWTGTVAAIAAVPFFSQANSGKSNFPAYIPFLMLVLVYALIMGGFKWESIKSKKFLKDLFQAEEIQ